MTSSPGTAAAQSAWRTLRAGTARSERPASADAEHPRAENVDRLAEITAAVWVDVRNRADVEQIEEIAHHLEPMLVDQEELADPEIHRLDGGEAVGIAWFRE